MGRRTIQANGYQFMQAYNTQKCISTQCMWAGCVSEAINSHTISLASIKRIAPLNSLKSIKKSSFNAVKRKEKKIHFKTTDTHTTTFPGFCKVHDSNIFADLDNFSGKITDKIAVLNHYRMLCFGLYQVKNLFEQERFLREASYEGKGGKKISEYLRVIKKGYWHKALKMSEGEIISRKIMCEKMIQMNQYQIYQRIVLGTKNNPLFTGRAGNFFHGFNRNMYKGSLDHMPYVVYSNLHDGEKSNLLFTLLPIDSQYINDITAFATHPDFLKRLEYLIYKESDFCIITNNQDIPQIIKILG